MVGIKVWVLTGDKIETAINIGVSAKLLDSEMDQHIVQESTIDGLIVTLNEILKTVELPGGERNPRK